MHLRWTSSRNIDRQEIQSRILQFRVNSPDDEILEDATQLESSTFGYNCHGQRFAATMGKPGQ
jgi:hypothetical protein